MIQFTPQTTRSNNSQTDSSLVRAAQLRALFFVAAILIIATSATFSFAQDAAKQYKTIPINAKFEDIDLSTLEGRARSEASKKNSAARQARTAGRTKAREGIQSGNINAAKDYLNGYIYPLMTQPNQLADSGTMRDGFFRTFMRTDLPEPARKAMIDSSIMPAMKTIANGEEYYPSARINAIALIARLDERGLSRNGSGTVPPIPSSAALQFLTESLTNNSLPTYLKPALMQGLGRFLIIDRAARGRILDDATRNSLTTFAVNTIQGKTPGQDQWDADLNYWLKRRSVQMLGQIGTPGPGDQHVDLMVQIANDASQTLWMQFDAVKSLKTIDFSTVNAEKAAKVVVGVAGFLQRSLAQEGARLETLKEELIYRNILYGDVDLEVKGTSYEQNLGNNAMGAGGMGMGMGMGDEFSDMMGGGNGGMFNGGGSTDEPEVMVELPTFELNLSRRRMKVLAFTCNDVLSTAPGLSSVTGEKEKKLVAEVGRFTQKFMKDSNAGIINLDEMDEMGGMMPEKTESYTSQLTSLCKKAATNVGNLVAVYNGNAGDNKGIDASPAPASNPVDLLNGLGG